MRKEICVSQFSLIIVFMYIDFKNEPMCLNVNQCNARIKNIYMGCPNCQSQHNIDDSKVYNEKKTLTKDRKSGHLGKLSNNGV